MSLGSYQHRFSKYIGMLLTWLYANGYECKIEEVKRSQVQVDANAISGAGIAKSLHLLSLAADLSIFKDGKFLETIEELKPIGEYWKSIDPECCWGGDFHSRPDADHFSLTYQGIK